MFITRLELYRCNRFFLRGIEKLIIAPTMKTQIILGTNGSGKSSLLRIGFTVMPPSKDDFEAGGYKILHCIANGHEYELRSEFHGKSKSPEHFFICDGEELNTGHTSSTQKELIREHFNMTQELHDVLSGMLKFTDMSSLQRREWITRLSSADFDYVMKLHGRVKKALRDTGAVIKHQSGRLVNETAKKMDDSEIDALNTQSKDLRNKLSDLFTQLDNSIGNDYTLVESGIYTITAKIEAVVDRLLTINIRPPEGMGGSDLDTVEELLDDLRTRRKMLHAALSEVSDQHQLVDKQIHEISILDDIDPAAVILQIESLEETIASLTASLKTGLEIGLLAKSQQDLGAVDDVVHALHDIVVNADDTYSREAIYERQSELNAVQVKYAAGTSRMSEIEYRINHIDNCHDTSCPNCKHVFKEGIDPAELEQLKSLLKKGEAFKHQMETKMNTLREYLGNAKEADDRRYELERLRNQHPGLAGLWNLFTAAGGVNLGRSLIPLCRDFISDSEKAIKISQCNFELAPLIEKMNQIHKLDNAGSLRELHGALSMRIATIQSELNENQVRLNVVERYYKDRKEFSRLLGELEGYKTEQDKLFLGMVDFTLNEHVAGLIKKYQVSLAMLESTLTEAEMQAGIVKDIEKSLQAAKQEEVSLHLLEKILSPKDGLIAEQILVFINTFIGKINEVIAKVWGYNLALDNCNLEEGELDYKFPMYIHTRENMISDISCGSDSQIDIVNQAFRLVVYKFMQLSGYPLYLDELGRTFDEVHRHNLTLAIKDLIDDETFSQLFFISHSFESQNSYPNSQIAVIDDSHVSLKRKYNEHVEIY